MNMMNMTNLTPHAIHIFAADGKTQLATVPPSGTVARVAVTRKDAGITDTGIPIFVSTYGQVQNLPEPVEGTLFIVSTMVRQAVPDRRDVMSPGELIRDDKGQPIGCRGLEANA